MKVRHHLGEVDWFQFRDGFQLYHHTPLNQEVHPIAAFEVLAVESERHWRLAFDLDAMARQQRGEARFIGGFEQARSELAVDRDRVTDDSCRDGIELLHSAALPRPR
ncbi:MAG TPA: hypothetical protein VMN60_06355, partial [Longimicrobiales bacterium]|nr:hypothetical protein [Longimicrobiales bacterium]